MAASLPVPNEPADFTRLMQDLARRANGATERLARAVYPIARRIARRQFAREPSGHTLQPTAVANSALLALLRHAEHETPADRVHLHVLLARFARNELRNYHTYRHALRRGGAHEREPLCEETVPAAPAAAADHTAPDRLLADTIDGIDYMDDPEMSLALSALSLQVFIELTVDEIATAQCASPSTIDRRLRAARAFVRARMIRTRASENLP